MAAKWRIFRRPIIVGEKTVVAIVQATVVLVLHNYIKKYEKNQGIRLQIKNCSCKITNKTNNSNIKCVYVNRHFYVLSSTTK